MLDRLLYILGRALIGTIQSLPLPLVGCLGHLGGALAWHLDRRHRETALENLTLAFPEKSAAEINALARENFRRLGESYACGIKTAGMNGTALRRVLTYKGVDHIGPRADGHNVVFAIGHFGNFELYTRASLFMPGWRLGATYRALRQPSLTRLMVKLRSQSGVRSFERRRDSQALKAAMRQGGLLMSFMADQHASASGVILPFFGRECSTLTAPAVFALRYDSPLHTAVCRRVAFCRWSVEIGPRIPTHEAGHPRSVEAIMTDVNAALETAIRADPANWFWVHRRWKPPTQKQLARSKASAS